MRPHIRWVVVVCCAVVGLHALPAEARRVALVIGNAAYKVEPLLNPLNDAAAVAEALGRQLKFDKVILRKDLGLDGFRAALRELAREATGAELGVIFFAGHGMEVAGRNYLIPTDAVLKAARDVELEAIALNTVLDQLDGVKKLKLVILDACRNNPFPVAGAKRSVRRGLIGVEPDGSNTLIAYAAKEGTTADDGVGRHSPFTQALLKRIATPRLDVRRLFGYVSEDVLAATSRTQEPWLYGRLGGAEIFLDPVAVAPTGLSDVISGPTPAVPNEAAKAWALVKDTQSIAALEVFIRRFGGTFEGDLAKVRLGELKQAEEDARTRAAEAERQRLAMLRQQEEEERKRAEARRRAEEDARAARQHLPAPVGGAAACAEKGVTQYCVSSMLPTGGVNIGHYGPRSLFDNDQATAWVEGKSGDGIGEWIVLSWPLERQLSGLRVVNGYGKSSRLFGSNGRVARARLEFSNGRSIEVSLRDTQVEQHVAINPTVRTRWVRLQILDVVRGWKHADTAISELSPVFE